MSVGIGPKEDTPRDIASYSSVVLVADLLCIVHGLEQRNDTSTFTIPDSYISYKKLCLLWGKAVHVIVTVLPTDLLQQKMLPEFVVLFHS